MMDISGTANLSIVYKPVGVGQEIGLAPATNPLSRVLVMPQLMELHLLQDHTGNRAGASVDSPR